MIRKIRRKKHVHGDWGKESKCRRLADSVIYLIHNSLPSNAKKVSCFTLVTKDGKDFTLATNQGMD